MDVQSTFAIVVGIEQYEAGWKLNGAANDAIGVARWLRHAGVPAAQIILVLDTLDPNQERAKAAEVDLGIEARTSACQSDIRNLFEKELKKTSFDNLIVYWCGHGFVSRSDQRALLVSDATEDNKRAINVDELLRFLKSNGVHGYHRQIVMIDACATFVHDLNIDESSLSTIGFRSGAPRHGVQQFVLFAAASGQAAAHNEREQRGVFTAAVLDRLDSPGSPEWPPDMPALAEHVRTRLATAGSPGPRGQEPVLLELCDWVGNVRSLPVGRRQLPVLPARPRQIVERPELLTWMRDVLTASAPDRGLTTAAFIGSGGAGKSTMARIVADDPAVSTRFPDGVMWLKLGRSPDLPARQSQLLAMMGVPQPISDVTHGAELLRELTTGTSHLVVLDDVWDRDHLRAFGDIASTNALLVTTRHKHVLDLGSNVWNVGLVDEATALQIMTAWADSDPADLPESATDLARLCGGVPLALASAGALAAEIGWPAVAQRIAKKDLAALSTAFPDYPYPNLFAALEVSVEALNPQDRQRYLSLTITEGRGEIPAQVASTLWSSTGMNEQATEDTLAMLASRALVRYDGLTRTFGLHDLQFAVIGKLVGTDQARDLHRQLGLGMLQAWGGLDNGLPNLIERSSPDDRADQYGIEHVVDHLVAGGQIETVHTLLGTETPAGDNLWFHIHDSVDRLDLYRRDLTTAHRLAETATDLVLAQQLPAPTIGLEIRYALMSSSVVSIASNIPTRLLKPFVESGLLSCEKALGYARAHASPLDRVAALASLLPVVSDVDRGALTKEVLAAARAGIEQLPGVAFAALMWKLEPITSIDERKQLLEAFLMRIRSREKDIMLVMALLSVAELVPADQREPLLHEALVAARAPYAFGIKEADCLVALAACRPAGRRREIITQGLNAARKIDSCGVRSATLVDLAELMTGIKRQLVLREAIHVARREESAHRRCVALIRVAKLAPKRRRNRIFREAMTLAREADNAVSSLVEELPVDLLEDFWPVVRAIDDPAVRAFALTLLGDRFSAVNREQALGEALEAARAIADRREPRRRAEAVAEVALRLPDPRRSTLLTEALRGMRLISDLGDQAPVLASFASQAGGTKAADLLVNALSQARSSPEGEARIRALGGVVDYLPTELRRSVLDEMLDIVEIRPREDWPHLLAGLAEHLTSECVARALDLANSSADVLLSEVSFARFIADLPVRLPFRSISGAVNRIISAVNVGFFARVALLRLSPQITDDLFSEISTRLPTLYNEIGQAFMLATLVQKVQREERDALVDRLLDISANVDDPSMRHNILAALVATTSSPRKGALLREAELNAYQISSRDNRVSALVELARHAEGNQQVKILVDARNIAQKLDAELAAHLRQSSAVVAQAAVNYLADSWIPFLRPTLSAAISEGRADVLRVMRLVAPAVYRRGGAEASREGLNALLDTARWWP